MGKDKKTPGAPEGNQNRVKSESGEKATSNIIMRVPTSKKAAYVKAAQKEGGKSLTDFILNHLDDYLKENHPDIAEWNK